MSLPELSETLAEPDPEEAVALELDELWSIRPEKSEQALGLDRLVPDHPPGRRLRHRRPQPGDLSKTLGGRPFGLSPRPLLQRLLGGVPGSDPC